MEIDMRLRTSWGEVEGMGVRGSVWGQGRGHGDMGERA